MPTTLQFTDGTTTIDLIDTSAINVLRQAWSPKVSTRKQNKSAGVCPYEDVVEEMSMSITGATTTALLSNLEGLVSLLEQVHEWKLGDGNAAAVTIEYQPQNSSDTSTALIVDLPDNWLQLPNEFEFGAGTIAFLTPVVVRFVRRGLWYTGTESATGTSTTEPQIQTRSWTGSSPLLAPVKMEIADGNGTYDGSISTPVNSKGYLLWAAGDAANDSDFGVTDANSFTSGAVFSSHVDTSAWGGATMRAIPTATTTARLTHLNWLNSTGLFDRPGRLAFFARLRNNSSTVSWTASVEVGYNEGWRNIQTKSVLIGTANNDPQVVYLGSVYAANMNRYISVRFNFTPSTTGSGDANSLEVDALAHVEIGSRGGAVYLEHINRAVNAHDTVIDPGFVDQTSARAYEQSTSGANTLDLMPFRGDLWIPMQNVDGMRWAILAQTDTDWRMLDGDVSGSPSTYTYDADITYYNTVLVPT